MSKQSWEGRKNRHAYEPTELNDGRWQIKGLVTSAPCTRITALLFAFKHFERCYAREYLFWEIANIFWQKGYPDDDVLLEKNKFSEWIIHDLSRHKYTAFGGCGSSGKSHVVAAWSIVRYLSDPRNTMVFVTTTTLKDADQRIWGSFIDLLEPIASSFPVRERPSMHDYVYQPPDGNKMKVNRGIFLVAAEKKKTKEAMGRFIGKKARHIILAADELGELSPAIMHAAVSNLSKGGRKSFQAVGMSNPDSRFDAFGIWAEPKVGWENVDIFMDKTWTTRWGGFYRRLDAYDSPHLYRTDSYLPTQGDIDEAMELLGENSRAFMRMWRAVFFDGGEENGVYSELELSKSGCLTKGPALTRVIGRGAGMDLGYTSGGDRTLFRAYELGYAADGRLILKLFPLETLKDDAASSEPRAYQMANDFVRLLRKYSIAASHVCVDATAGGSPICDVLDQTVRDHAELPESLRGNVFRVSFGSSPSTLRPNPRVNKSAKEMFRNRVTELWFVGKEFLRCQQLYGLDHDTAKEFTQREYSQRKVGSGLRVQLESKIEYKNRTNNPSPDAADTTALAIDSARQCFSFFPVEPRKDDGSPQWRRRPRSITQLDMASANGDAWL